MSDLTGNLSRFSFTAHCAEDANADEKRGLTDENQNPSRAEEPDQHGRKRDRQPGPESAGVPACLPCFRLSRAIKHEGADER